MGLTNHDGVEDRPEERNPSADPEPTSMTDGEDEAESVDAHQPDDAERPDDPGLADALARFEASGAAEDLDDVLRALDSSATVHHPEAYEALHRRLRRQLDREPGPEPR